MLELISVLLFRFRLGKHFFIYVITLTNGIKRLYLSFQSSLNPSFWAFLYSFPIYYLYNYIILSTLDVDSK